MDRRTIATERLTLSPITWDDAGPLAVLHADARVMSNLKHGPLTRAQSDAIVADYEAEWRAFGFGSWTVRERAGGMLVGFGGLRVHDGGFGIALRAAFAADAQGKGYGPELGRAAVGYAFGVAGIDHIVALTRQTNVAGQRSLEKFGMRRERELARPDGRAMILYVLDKPTAG